MTSSLTERDRKELEEILADPVKRAELANRAIDAWVLQGLPKSRRSSKNSKKRS